MIMIARVRTEQADNGSSGLVAPALLQEYVHFAGFELPSWLAEKLHRINSRMQCKVIRVQWVGVVIINQLQYRGKEAYLQTY